MTYGSETRPLLVDVGLKEQRCRLLDGCAGYKTGARKMRV